MSVPDTAGRDPAGEFHRDALPEVPSSVCPRTEDAKAVTERIQFNLSVEPYQSLLLH
jgi:hypothetical protein